MKRFLIGSTMLITGIVFYTWLYVFGYETLSLWANVVIVSLWLIYMGCAGWLISTAFNDTTKGSKNQPERGGGDKWTL